MAITHYLAMTSAEMATASSLPPKVAWMACHFSPYSTGLTNIPDSLPENSMLILNDRTPIRRHDPEQILRELNGAIERLHCAGILLDFQQPNIAETSRLTEHLVKNLSCITGISKDYALDGFPVLLPPVPADTSLTDYIAPWKNRTIWLESAMEGQQITLSPSGAVRMPLKSCEMPSNCHRDRKLHCHYRAEIRDNCAEFHLFRTRKDLEELLEEANTLGIETFFGLYQELHI